MKRKFSSVVHYVAKAPTSVAECLKTHFRLSPEKVTELFGLGAIYLNQTRVQSDLPLPAGAHLQVFLSPKRYAVDRVDWKASVVQENDSFIVINKPAGIPVHSTNDNLIENVLHCLRETLQQTTLITQRLDTPVSGLLVLAKNTHFQKNFNALLASHQVKKYYRALVEKPPTLGLQIHYMDPSEKIPKVVSREPKKGWLKCELSIRSLEPCSVFVGKTNYEVEVELHTGRTHQIRTQLAELGCPILGDKLYGGRLVSAIRRSQIALFASELKWKDFHFKALPEFKKQFRL